MLGPVVIPVPLALLAVAAFGAACYFTNRFLEFEPPTLPTWLIPVRRPAASGRHHLGGVNQPYRPHSAPTFTPEAHREAPAAPARTWTPEDLNAALDAAELAAVEQALAEIANAQAGWDSGWTADDEAEWNGDWSALAEARWDEIPTRVLAVTP